MPFAYSNSEQLIILTTTKLSKRLPNEWSTKFKRKKSGSMVTRLKLICNIAIAIHILHSTDRYILKDLKPQNILVNYNGKVSLIDMDSIQITENSNLLFAATAMTPDFMPPEFYTKNVGKSNDVPIDKSWDYFAISVIFYQLIFGLHPYVVTPKNLPDTSTNDISENIHRNLFPFGPNNSEIESYPPLHGNFKKIPTEIQNLFKSAFSNQPSSRPAPTEWVKVIKSYIKK